MRLSHMDATRENKLTGLMTFFHDATNPETFQVLLSGYRWCNPVPCSLRTQKNIKNNKVEGALPFPHQQFSFSPHLFLQATPNPSTPQPKRRYAFYKKSHTPNIVTCQVGERWIESGTERGVGVKAKHGGCTWNQHLQHPNNADDKTSLHSQMKQNTG